MRTISSVAVFLFIILIFIIYVTIFGNQIKLYQQEMMKRQGQDSYKSRVRNRFKQEVHQIVERYSLPELVLVLDLHSAFLLSNIFSMTELVAMKVVYIEKMEVKRKKLDRHALYFCQPTKDNIQILITDFSSNQPNPQYRRIHILFTTFVHKSILKQMALCPQLLKRIAKNSIKQFYHSNRILAPNLIDMGMPYLSLAFSKDSTKQQIRRQLLSKKIVQCIANMNNVNRVKIYYKKAANSICQRMARQVHKQTKSFLGNLLKNESITLNKQGQDITLLLLDRSVDTVTPLMHSFTYQALLFDLFTVSMVMQSDLKDKGCYSYEQIQNSIYEKYRYRHLTAALEQLPQALQQEKGRLQLMKGGNHQTFNIKQLDKNIQQLKTNIQKLQMIWTQFKKQNIQRIAELQQSLATGITDNSQNTSSSKLVNDVRDIIANPSISINIKLRLALLTLSCIKMSRTDYQALLDMFQGDQRQILKNINALGVTYDDSVSKSTKTITKDQQNLAMKRMETTKMPLNRYTSIIQLILPLFCKILKNPHKGQTIDQDVFGEISCSVYRDSEDKNENKFNPARLVVVMLGGLSWAEVSAIRSMEELKDTIIMSDYLMNPQQFLKQLVKINILNP